MDLLPIHKISPFPLVNLSEIALPSPGGFLGLSDYCKKKFLNESKCREHYAVLKLKADGCHQCPYGLASLKFTLLGRPFAVTGFIPFPRLGGKLEAARAKELSEHKVAVDSVIKASRYLEDIHELVRKDFEEQIRKYPLAFHELRKLNGAIKQRAERLADTFRDNGDITTIHSSAELMSNNLDLLEIMAAKDDLTELPLNSTINLWDLAYKCKKIYEFRARDRGIVLWLEGENQAIIKGNKKTFPSLLTVLFENAIKYSDGNSRISIVIKTFGRSVRLAVHNVSSVAIDTQRCFEKGFRSPTNIEGSGLGLFIAQLVAKQHLGIIKCEQKGEIKTFYLDLPVL